MKPVPVMLATLLLVTVLLATASPSRAWPLQARSKAVDRSLTEPERSLVEHDFRADPAENEDDRVPSDSVVVSRSTRLDDVLRKGTPEFAISTFSPSVVNEFRSAWRSVGGGTSPHESVILILRMYDGTYSARRQKQTYEYHASTFAWHPATVAVVHTHPNTCPAAPQPQDEAIADKYHVPMFTITNRGMFVYDPTTRKTTKVMEGLEWLDQHKWAGRALLAERNASN
ncbi:MAG TPA: hypothetical protein VKM94_11740 [Blastocatellia bacterium]|nr:hypothetical protein [Blastocatellia bacterium]